MSAECPKCGIDLLCKEDGEFFCPSCDCPSCAALRARFSAHIVCICGSTRFKQAWISENARLTGEGNIVLAVGLWGHHERKYPDEATKRKLDELHLRKIDLCDWVWVLDIGGYIGESTRNEIVYAEARGKMVRYLSKEFPTYVEPTDPMIALTKERDEAREKVCAARELFEQYLRCPQECFDTSDGHGYEMQAAVRNAFSFTPCRHAARVKEVGK